MNMQHLCGKVISVDWFSSHGEVILDMKDPASGSQIQTHCPECGEEIFTNTLFRAEV
ncbi:MAG: hypothetical protein JZU60_01930 [Ilumatobacteraceae bacterium]|jgi:hypothetical protein|nr:hypothetical protein [Ilumatobacteraceae bacterium]